MSVSDVQQSDPVLYIYTSFFSYYLPSYSITSDWTEFPVLYNRTSLLLHSKCNGLHLLNASSPSIPLPPSPPWQLQVCSLCLWVSHRQIPYDTTYMWNLKYGANEPVYRIETMGSLRTRDCALCFTYHNSFNLMTCPPVGIVTSLYRWRKQGLEKLTCPEPQTQ